MPDIYQCDLPVTVFHPFQMWVQLKIHSFAFLLIFLNVDLLPSGKNIEKENVINMISFLSLNMSCSCRNSSHGLRHVSPAVCQEGHLLWGKSTGMGVRTPAFKLQVFIL